MPTLISNHKKRVVETKLQKAYSIIAQAMKFSENEHGDSDIWDFSPLIDGASNPQIVTQIDKEYFSKYLKNCQTENSNALVYGSGISMTRNQYYACSGFKIISQPLGNNTGANNIYKVPTFLFIIYLNNIDKSDIAKTGTGKLLGTDKFLFTYQSNQLYTGGVSVGGTMNAVGVLHSRIHEDIGTGQCKQPIGLDIGGVAEQGEACATMIQRNGWKIPDDYPISF